jgi:hypothetical protein
MIERRNRSLLNDLAFSLKEAAVKPLPLHELTLTGEKPRISS